jgi:hypothetical protein
MAAIYGNNLHEKLQGVAISKEYLKYNTPFCDLVDDPEWQVDINLALNFNSALHGNLGAANSVVQSLTLNSNVLDNSTIEWYVHKMTYNPLFKSAIDNMRNRWSNPAGWDDDFQFDFNKALKDCLNSPCNLFTETSDSIGRMAQSASTKTSDNTWGVGALSASFTNMIDGLDQTIFNKIPSIFKDAFVEVAQVANKAYTNTQSVLTGKKNLTVFKNKVNNSKSFRSPSDMFRYTPDVKSHYDYSAASSNILGKIKEDIGGCFNRFEFKYRYNPYENNMSRPLGEKTLQVNGRKYDTDATGTADRRPDNSARLAKQTSTGPIKSGTSSSNTTGKSYTDGNTKISTIYSLESKGSSNGAGGHYSIFAGLVDVDTNTLWYETYSKNPNDELTLQGSGNIGPDHRIGISHQGTDLSFIKRALNGEGVSDSELEKYSKSTQVGSYAAGYKHDLTDKGMETLHNTTKDMIINDGVAISKKLFRKFMNDPSLEVNDPSYKDPEKANKFFVAARPVGETTWKFYKVCDSNSQSDINVDFTVGAYKHFLKSFKVGNGDLSFVDENGRNLKKKINGTKWSKVLKIFHQDIKTVEVRVCQGNIDDIKANMPQSSSIGSKGSKGARGKAGKATLEEGLSDGETWAPGEEEEYDRQLDLAVAEMSRTHEGPVINESPLEEVQRAQRNKIRSNNILRDHGVLSEEGYNNAIS